MNQEAAAVLASYVLLSFVEPQAAAGALFGAMFYLSMPHGQSPLNRILSVVSAIGIGYASGISKIGEGNEMLVAIFGSAIGVALLTSVRKVVIERIIDILKLLPLPWRR